MNAKCYRTVFNAARGMLVAVEESARGMGKGRSAGSRASRRRAGSMALLAAGALVAPGLHSQSITPDRSVPGPHPVVGVAANGTPVVNINAPSAAGVSANSFTNYNVGAQGVVLNNSGQNSQTQIAGWVQGNPFLGNNAARVILNQVTSGNPSTLAGATEVAGNPANVILANPAGITCSGCSFIAAPRVTLTTGTPNFDALGNVSGLSVQQGQITINGQGLDAHGAQLDLLSRAMAINGAVWAERINAVAGANSIDYGTVTPTAIAGVGPSPLIAIDVGQLGSMYGGGATRLIGTEQGLGVNIGGNLAALTGTLNVATNGDVTITPTGRVQSASDMGITAPNVTNQGAISSTGSITVQGNTNNAGTLVAGGNATVVGSQITNTGTIGAGIDTNGNATQVGSVTLNAANAVRNSGALVGGQDIGLHAQSIDTSAGSIGAQGAVTLAATGDVSTHSASVSGHGVTVQAAGNLDNTAGNVWSTGDLQVNAAQVTNRNGSLGAAGNVTATVASLDNTSGTLGTNGGNLAVNSPGAITNASGKLLAAQDASITAASLNNQAGTVSARNLNLNTGTGTLDNTQGAISAAGTGNVTAGSLLNAGGTLASNGDLSAKVASVDNTSGTLGSSTGNLTLTSAGNVANAGGKLLAGQDIALAASGLGNQAGTVAGRNVDVKLGAGTLDNTGGTVSANGTLGLQAAEVSNTRGKLMGSGVSVDVNTLTNAGGSVSSTTTLDVKAQTLSNDQGKLVSNGALTAQAGDLTNVGGQVASNADVTVSGTTLDNSAGLMHAGGTLSVTGTDIVNRNTNTANTGLEGASVALTATHALDNTAGAIRSDQSTQITAPTVNNTQGAIQSAGAVGVNATTALTNTQGNLNGSKSVRVTAGQMTGDGTVQSQGSVALSLQSDFANTGTVAAGQDVSVTTTGNVINSGTLSAGRNLAVSASNITNTSTGELTGTVSNTLTAQQTVNNDGLIDGGATVVKARDVVNTGRLYGDTVAIGANTLTNTVNAQGVAGVIASRGDMDIGVQTLNNQEHALIYSAGDMRIGGALDANNRATGTAQTITNGSATINADGNLTISANQINNQNNHFATSDQTSAGAHLTSYRLNGSTQDIDPSTIRLFHRNNGETTTGDNWQWLGDDDYKVMLLPSAQYPFSQFGPPFNYSNGQSGGGAVGTAYIPETSCWQDACTQPTNPEQFLYKTTDAIWGVFGITPPQEIGTEPDQAMYFATGRVQQYQADHDAWQQRHDAAVAQYQVLNNAINAFNGNVRSREVDAFTIYDGTQQITRTVVTQSDPGLITSGGNMTFNVGTVTNQASQIVAGGDLTGSNILGTKPNNVGIQGTQSVTTTGTASYTYIESGGAFSGDTRAYSTSPWQGQTVQTNFQLDVSATNGTGPNSQHPVKSVPVAAAAGQGNGTTTASPGQVAPITVTLPGGAVIRTVVPNLTLPNNALYHVIGDPGSHYLIETDPRFTNYRSWISSDFMLSQFQNDPNATLKRIGDGFYEQQLIQQEIIRATGQRFIGDYTNNEEEYKALLGAGVTAGKAFGLNIGTALTDTQMAQLTSDIVWMVKQTVSLPDGSQQDVLVPQVYLRARSTDMDGSGTLMAGRNVSFQTDGDAVNSGTIASKNVTIITADTIQNSGTLAGSTLLAQAKTDLNNLGGHIQADQALLSAGRDVNIVSTTANTRNITTSGANISQVASVDAGTLSIKAGRDASLTAAAINSVGDTTITASRDVNLNAVRQSSEEHVVWGDKNRSDRASYADAGTQIQTGGNLAIGAGQDVNATAAYANATGGIQVAAGRDVSLNAGQSQQSVRDEHFQSEKGFLSSKTTHTIDSASQTNAVGTTLSGDSVNVLAGHDIDVKGSNVAGTQDVTLMAKNNVNIESATASSSESHYRKETQSGLMGSGGVGFMVGNRMQSEDDKTANTTAVASTVGSTNGNVSIAAGNQYRQAASNVIATQGDADILAKKVEITEAREAGHSSQESRFEQSGLTVAVSAPVIAALQTASQMGTAASQTSDTRMKLLAGGATALAGKNAADAVAADPKSAGGASISITVGGSQSRSLQTQDTDSAAGSTVKAGGDVRIRAIGSGKDSTLTVQGSDIQAGNNVLLKSDGDVNLQAGKNTSDMERSSSSLSGGVGVAVSVSSNGASFGVTANASASRGTGNGHDVTWTNTHVNAGNQLTIESGGDTNLKGAVASGKQVVANVGGDLNVASLQDTSTFHSKDQSISGSVTVGYGFSGSVSASQQKIDADYASVTEQSGIKAGDGGFQVNVHGNTDLKGAVITSTDKAVQDGLNSLATATLTTSEIQNHADYNASSIGIGGGYSSSGSGVGTNQKGEATTGGDKVPGTTLPSAGGFSAAPPIVMGANGSGSSTTTSGISGGAIHITDGTKQQALTGKDADQTVASVNRNVSTNVDTTGKLAPIFNEREIRTGFEITGAFIRETNTFLSNRAVESTQAQKALDAEKAKPADEQDQAKIAQLTQTLQDNATWEMGGTGHMLLTALAGGAGGNVTGGMGQFVQSSAAYYLQSLATQEVKGVADLLDSETARAALQGLVACAGAAAAQGQGCGAGAAGAAASVVLNNLLDSLNGEKASTLTPEQKQARENIISTIVVGAAAGLGGNAAAATIAAQIETENNAANFVKGTTERVQKASLSVGDTLRKPKGSLTRSDVDAALATLKQAASSGNLSNQEALNFTSLWMSVVERAAVENLMSPQEIVGSKQFMQAAVASLAFSGGGNTSIRSPSAGPKLFTTESEFIPAPPAKQVTKNKFVGDVFEEEKFAEFQNRMVDSAQQVTVKTQSGTKTRLDMIGRDTDGKYVCEECKASATAPLTKNQEKAFPEIETGGAVVVGKGKPGFPGGTVIPPTKVEIIRPTTPPKQ